MRALAHLFFEGEAFFCLQARVLIRILWIATVRRYDTLDIGSSMATKEGTIGPIYIFHILVCFAIATDSIIE